MAAPRLFLDHIAVTAATLDEGTAHVAKVLGIDLPSGGAHPRMGTHNRLLALGPELFLEIIAVDEEARPPDRPRWFNLDRAANHPPRLSTWVLGTTDIEAVLHDFPAALGPAVEMTRGDLKWKISIPDDGSLPWEGALPTLIQWPDGPHPAHRMTDLGFRLNRLEIRSPWAERVQTLLSESLLDSRIHFIQAETTNLRANIRCPNGRVKTLT